MMKMKQLQLKVLAVVIVAACFCAGSVNAEDAVKLKTSKEIPASIFGTQTHFGQWWDYKGVLPLVEKAGLKWIRDDFGWQNIEMEKGVLNLNDPAAAKKLLKTNAYFRNAENYVNDAVSRGINISMVLVYGNKHYPFEDFEEFKKGYANYCAFAASHFKGRVKVWEIWNEPCNFAIRGAYGGSWNAKPKAGETTAPWMDKFTDLVIAAAKAIREVDPKAIIITGDTPPGNYRMLDILKAKDAVHLLDGIVLHPYTYSLPPEIQPYGGKSNDKRDGVKVTDDDRTYSSMIRLMKEKMKAVGMRTTDIYATEFGYTTFHRMGSGLFLGFTETAQAKYLARFFVLHLVHGVKLAIQYDFQDDGIKLKNTEHNFGLVKHPSLNYKPKPAYYAVQRVCSLLSEPVKQFRPDWQITVSPDRYPPRKTYDVLPLNRVEKYLFRNSETGEMILVLWNAIRPLDRQHLLSDVTLDTADYTSFAGIDIMTGESFKVNSSVKDGKTIFKNVIIPDYPVVIKMLPKKQR